MKKFFMFFMLSFVLVLGACGNGDDTDTTDETDEEDVDTEEVVDEEEEATEEDAAEEDAAEEEEAAEDEEASSASDFDAEEFARTNCTACHGSDFTGQMGPDIVGFDEDALKDAVREGPGSMPSYTENQINDEELDVLASYFSEL